MKVRVRIAWSRRNIAPAQLVCAVCLGSSALLTGGVSRIAGLHDAVTIAPALQERPQEERRDRACPRVSVPDRETILAMIRDHRRASDEGWLNELASAIYAESVEAELDPLFVATIVAKESSFRSRVVSRAGAVGLMQIRPFVGRDVARRLGIEWNGIETLHQPHTNVRLGISYYKHLVERFEGNVIRALSAYNFGPSRVARQVRRGTFTGSHYANSILSLYDRLKNARQPSSQTPDCTLSCVAAACFPGL